jgi:glycine dehydrogenase subunit 2
MNAMLGITRPGDRGVDIIQLNMHKSFSTPHGGGGPGAGPVGVSKILKDFLPSPTVVKKGKRYLFDEPKKSIGRLHGFYGNVGVMIRAYAYILSLGSEGISRVGRISILNANYLKARLSGFIDIAFEGHCQHEFVASLKSLRKYGVGAGDVAKRLLDFGFYAPTVYFPSIVEEAFMIEPTETESKETLDLFAEALIRIFKEASSEPSRVKQAPENLPVRRLDEVAAARNPDLSWKCKKRNDFPVDEAMSGQIAKK